MIKFIYIIINIDIPGCLVKSLPFGGVGQAFKSLARSHLIRLWGWTDLTSYVCFDSFKIYVKFRK